MDLRDESPYHFCEAQFGITGLAELWQTMIPMNGSRLPPSHLCKILGSGMIILFLTEDIIGGSIGGGGHRGSEPPPQEKSQKYRVS